MRQSITCIAMILAVLTLAFGESNRLGAAEIDGATFCGCDLCPGACDLVPGNDDTLSGTFKNVGTFHIATGIIVKVKQRVPLSITANEIIIEGTLDGTGAGNPGGDGVTNIFNCDQENGSELGMRGEGTGDGGGGLFGCAINGSGGGGGGYGGDGGQSGSFNGDGDPGPATGGAENGDPMTMSIEMGSGGGSGAPYNVGLTCFLPNNFPGSSGKGGNGGGAISLFGPLVLTGTIIVNGEGDSPSSPLRGTQPLGSGCFQDIGTSAGGGGSGGGVLLDSGLNDSSFLNGLISATGGAGGNGGPKEFGSGGGGGGGGRIKLFGTATLGANFSRDVSGGSGGLSASGDNSIMATPGQDGTFFNATIPIPPDEADSDGDGVADADDRCPDTVIPESVPRRSLGVNRFALVDDDGMFDTTSPRGKGPRKAFTIEDTAGCSCEQIIDQLGLGRGHTKFGCSIGAMKTWVGHLN